MSSSRSIANETLGSQVHFPWLPFLSGLGRRLHWAHLTTRGETRTEPASKRLKVPLPILRPAVAAV